MLLEEIDGCELSISSFLIAEKFGQIAAAICAWIEEIDGIPSSVLKGNLLSYSLPKKCLENASSFNKLFQALHIEYIPNTIQIGLVYVSSDYRGMNLASKLIDEQIMRLLKIKPNITDAYVQVFANNISAIKAYEKAKFEIVLVKESTDENILNYLPSNKKVLMRKKLLIN
jgi:ribosomal protein S18 acetylase RimI-like enzyme